MDTDRKGYVTAQEFAVFLHYHTIPVDWPELQVRACPAGEVGFSNGGGGGGRAPPEKTGGGSEKGLN